MTKERRNASFADLDGEATWVRRAIQAGFSFVKDTSKLNVVPTLNLNEQKNEEPSQFGGEEADQKEFTRFTSVMSEYQKQASQEKKHSHHASQTRQYQRVRQQTLQQNKSSAGRILALVALFFFAGALIRHSHTILAKLQTAMSTTSNRNKDQPP